MNSKLEINGERRIKWRLLQLLQFRRRLLLLLPRSSLKKNSTYSTKSTENFTQYSPLTSAETPWKLCKSWRFGSGLNAPAFATSFTGCSGCRSFSSTSSPTRPSPPSPASPPTTRRRSPTTVITIFLSRKILWRRKFLFTFSMPTAKLLLKESLKFGVMFVLELWKISCLEPLISGKSPPPPVLRHRPRLLRRFPLDLLIW